MIKQGKPTIAYDNNIIIINKIEKNIYNNNNNIKPIQISHNAIHNMSNKIVLNKKTYPAKKNSKSKPKSIRQRKAPLVKKPSSVKKNIPSNETSVEETSIEKTPIEKTPIEENSSEECPYKNVFNHPEEYPVHIIMNKSLDTDEIVDYIITKKNYLAKMDREAKHALELHMQNLKNPAEKKDMEKSLALFDKYVEDNLIIIISTPKYANYVHKSYDELKKLEDENTGRLSGVVIIT